MSSRKLDEYGAAARFDPHAQKTPDMQTAGVYAWSEGYLGVLDAFVGNVRSFLDFEGYEGMDNLRAILERNRKQSFVHSWSLDMPLRVVSTRKNAVFK